MRDYRVPPQEIVLEPVDSPRYTSDLVHTCPSIVIIIINNNHPCGHALGRVILDPRHPRYSIHRPRNCLVHILPYYIHLLLRLFFLPSVTLLSLCVTAVSPTPTPSRSSLPSTPGPCKPMTTTAVTFVVAVQT
jgi:hypothetical protein